MADALLPDDAAEKPGFLRSHRSMPDGWRRAKPGEAAEGLVLTAKESQYVVPVDTLKPAIARVWVPVPSADVTATAGRFVHLVPCRRCGDWFPVMDGDDSERCAVCRQPHTPDEVARGAMLELRTCLDEYEHAAPTGEWDKVHAAFVALHDACSVNAPVLLRELERLYGNQRMIAAGPGEQA